MTRILLIENCYHECSNCWYDDDGEVFRCTVSNDPDRPGYIRDIPFGRTEPPDWCPLEEASVPPCLKLYVWYNVFRGYTPGIAFALATSEENARKLIEGHCEDWELAKGELMGAPMVYDAPMGFHMWGGG